jgi:hypothetical protein
VLNLAGIQIAAKTQAPNASSLAASEERFRNPSLLQYAGTGAYYGRVKINGKIKKNVLNASAFVTQRSSMIGFSERPRNDI